MAIFRACRDVERSGVNCAVPMLNKFTPPASYCEMVCYSILEQREEQLVEKGRKVRWGDEKRVHALWPIGWPTNWWGSQIRPRNNLRNWETHRAGRVSEQGEVTLAGGSPSAHPAHPTRELGRSS